jgi:hypothetical protein
MIKVAILDRFRFTFWASPPLLLAYFICLVNFTYFLDLASAQGNPCDPGLHPVSDPTGYIPRGSRCEGVYVSPVSASSLELISLLRGKLHYKLQPKTQLILSSPNIADIASGPVRTRAIARPLRTYYRMDATLPTTRRMSWSIDDVLLPLRLSADSIGVFGWVEKGTEKIYVPLRVAQPGDSTPAGAVELMVRSAVDIDRLAMSETPLLPDGKTRQGESMLGS